MREERGEERGEEREERGEKRATSCLKSFRTDTGSRSSGVQAATESSGGVACRCGRGLGDGVEKADRSPRFLSLILAVAEVEEVGLNSLRRSPKSPSSSSSLNSAEDVKST